MNEKLMQANGITAEDLEPVDKVASLEAKQDEYAADTDAALFDLDEAQTTYADETDQALFDLVDYISTLEARIEALEA